MQDVSTIKIYPLDLKDCGLTPKGHPMYRVVWADSRTQRVVQDGKAHDIPLYEAKAKGKWILERWTRPEDFLGVTREQWAAMEGYLGVQMDYPGDGDYELCGVFPDVVSPSLARLWAGQLFAGRENFSAAERAAAVREAYAQAEKEADAQKDIVIQNALERKEIHA